MDFHFVPCAILRLAAAPGGAKPVVYPAGVVDRGGAGPSAEERPYERSVDAIIKQFGKYEVVQSLNPCGWQG